MADTILIPNALPTPPNISELSRLSGFSRTTSAQALERWVDASLLDSGRTGRNLSMSPRRYHLFHPSLPGSCKALATRADLRHFAGVGCTINARYAASLGRTADESLLLAVLGLAIDGGAVILLGVAPGLWQARHAMWSLVAFTSWIGFTAMPIVRLWRLPPPIDETKFLGSAGS